MTGSEAIPRLAPRGKIAIPEVFTRSSATNTPAPASETKSPQTADKAQMEVPDAALAEEDGQTVAAAKAIVAEVVEPTREAFKPISPGLSNVSLPLGPGSKGSMTSDKKSEPVAEKVEVPVEAVVGDLVEFFMGKGQVRDVREDGMLEVWAMGWEMAGEQRPRFFVQKSAVKVVPTVYYKMPALEVLEIAAWLKQEGARLFKAGDFQGAAERYMKAIGALKTSNFDTNAHNARALEMMIPCQNNAATCYIKLKNYGDARLLSENVDTLCSALERNKVGKVMKALKDRGVGETKVLGQWWSKGLFLGGKACMYQGENDEAVKCLKKGSKMAKLGALSKLRAEINGELDKATKRLASQNKKAKKMWSKAFDKNSTEVVAEEAVVAKEVVLNGPESSVLRRLEELAKMGGVTSGTVTPAVTDEQGQEGGGEAEDEEEESESEEDTEDGEFDGQGKASGSRGLLWGGLVVGAVAVSVVALVWGKRRR